MLRKQQSQVTSVSLLSPSGSNLCFIFKSDKLIDVQDTNGISLGGNPEARTNLYNQCLQKQKLEKKRQDEIIRREERRANIARDNIARDNIAQSQVYQTPNLQRTFTNNTNNTNNTGLGTFVHSDFSPRAFSPSLFDRYPNRTDSNMSNISNLSGDFDAEHGANDANDANDAKYDAEYDAEYYANYYAKYFAEFMDV